MRTDMQCLRCDGYMHTNATALCDYCHRQEEKEMASIYVSRAKELVKAYMAHVIVDMNDVHKAFFELKLYGWALRIVSDWQYQCLGKDNWNNTIGVPRLQSLVKADQARPDVQIDWR